MKNKYLIITIVMLFLLTGCWWMESIRCEIDLNNNTCTYTFQNVFSIPNSDTLNWTDANAHEDWEEFKNLYEKDSLIILENIKILDKKMYVQNHQLFCEIKFHFKDLKDIIGNDTTISEGYRFKPDFGSIISTNGKIMNDSSIVWSTKQTKLIFSLNYSDEKSLSKSISLAQFFNE